MSSQLWWDTLTTGCWIHGTDIVWGTNAMIHWHLECLLVISGKYTFARHLIWQERIRDRKGEERSKYLLSNSWQCRKYLVVVSLSLTVISLRFLRNWFLCIITHLIKTALSPVVFKPKGNSYMLDSDFSLIFLWDSKSIERSTASPRMGHIPSQLQVS